jgi:hypothetical protein
MRIGLDTRSLNFTIVMSVFGNLASISICIKYTSERSCILDGERSLFIYGEYIIYSTASVTACVKSCLAEICLDMGMK